jgi:hypothetical protein
MGRAGPLSATELDEVQALLERVLPDPAGFAQRLALQVMTRWGEGAQPQASAFYTAAGTEDVTVGDIVITPDPLDADEPPVDTNILLAAALGACECWGLEANCGLCQGQGSAGWTQPDAELFEEFVKPAIARLPGVPARGHEQDGSVKADEDVGHHQPARGENG